jgi:aspartyl/asparaginyl-tRNA synthetase
MDFMTGLKRTHYCGDLRLADAGKTVTVAGWVQRQRDLGENFMEFLVREATAALGETLNLEGVDLSGLLNF